MSLGLGSHQMGQVQLDQLGKLLKRKLASQSAAQACENFLLLGW